MLAALIFGSYMIIPLTFFTTHAFDITWSPEDGGTFNATKSWSWRRDMLNVSDQTVMRTVLQDSFLALSNASTLPKWSSFQEALIPHSFEPAAPRVLPEGYVGYWRLEAESIRAELQCNTLETEPVSKSGSASPPSGSEFDGLKVWLHGNYSTLDGSTHFTTDPCFGQDDDGEEQRDLYCSHWELLSLVPRDSSAIVPVWIISAARFAGGMQFAHALLCQPRIFVGHGKTNLLSMDGSLNNAFIHAHTTIKEALLENDMANEYSRILNRSAFTPDTRGDGSAWTSGLRFDSPVVWTTGFRGDILSFASWKERYRNKLRMDNVISLAELSSLVYSTTFSVAAHTTDFVRVPIQAEAVPAIAQVLREVPASSRHLRLALGYVCALSLAMVAHIAVMYFHRDYRLPIAPESIENTWFFLYRSPLVKLIEEHIDDPHKLSLTSFYARVEALGKRYVFGRDADEVTWSNVKVDVVDGVNGAGGPDGLHDEDAPLMGESNYLDEEEERVT